MRKTVLVQAIACALISGAAHAAVKVEDKTFNTAANMLAYTEFELSGEPLAEALGLDLDVLDANRADEPTPFDFAAGIESYEYSEEAMYALNYQSGMGPHLVNGPQNLARGGTMASLGQRVLAMADAVGFPADEVPQGMYPSPCPTPPPTRSLPRRSTPPRSMATRSPSRPPKGPRKPSRPRYPPTSVTTAPCAGAAATTCWCPQRWAVSCSKR